MTMLSNDQVKKWRNAQQIFVSVDIVAAARSQLEFLSLVNSHFKLLERPVLDRAIERYQFCCLPLLARTSGSFIPPLDCSWIWHCHRLNPIQYAKDCKRLFGKVVDAPFTKTDSESTIFESINTWTTNFPHEPYALDMYDRHLARRYATRPLNVAYDLAEAAARQQKFYYQVSEPHYLDESFLLAAADRYKAFLHLVRTSDHASAFFVPTYDIDLMWHTHQLHPLSYNHDLTQLLGRVFGHDDTDSDRSPGGKLDNGFAKTRSVWEETYGLPYEKAGCMYRGDPPLPIPETPLFDPGKLPTLTTRKVISHLTGRNILQVRLSVQGIRGLSGDSTIYFVVGSLNHQKSLKLESKRGKASAEWNIVSEMTAEFSTEGVLVAVRQKKFLTSGTVGRLVIPWRNFLGSYTQSLQSGWFPLQETKKGAVVSLLMHISITPPVPGPYLFRSARVRDTGDDSATHESGRKGMWVTRTVFDHARNEAFVIRCRYKREGLMGLRSIPDAEKVVHVHEGGWTYKSSSYNTGSVKGRVLGSAWQLERSSQTSRTWSLMNGDTRLTVSKDSKDKHWNRKPQLRVETRSDCPITLLSGRQLNYAVPRASQRQEAWFVTMVRFSRDAPQGKATALFNWRSGGMEIDPSEDVLLVLLLSATISMSVSDIIGKSIPPRTEKRKREIVSEADADHWGAFVHHQPGSRDTRGDDSYLGHGGHASYWYDGGGSYCGGGCGISKGSGCGGAGADGGGCGGGCGGGGCGGGGCGGGCGG